MGATTTQDLKDFQATLIQFAQKIPPKQEKYNYFKNLLNNLIIDIEAAIQFKENKLLSISATNHEFVSDEYVKHIFRTLIIELFSNLEHQLAENWRKNGSKIKTKNESIFNCAEEALKITRSKKVKELLGKIKKKVSSRDIIEFNTTLDLILGRESNKTKEEWKKFFNGFRNLRNSTHNNFHAQNDFTWNGRTFSKGDRIGLSLKGDLGLIIQKTNDFLKLLI